MRTDGGSDVDGGPGGRPRGDTAAEDGVDPDAEAGSDAETSSEAEAYHTADGAPDVERDGPTNTPATSGSSAPSGEAAPDPDDGLTAALRWFLATEDDTVVFVRETLSTVLAVALLGFVLFAAAGVWPPMVAVESGSMEPNMHPGDLVFVMDEGRFVPDAAHDDTGVVTFEDARSSDYRTFSDYGDVIVFAAPDQRGPPIIHRAHFWVEEGENWYDRADPRYVEANECGATPTEGLRNCPAPHDGFVTKGDANPYYDQAQGISEPVRPEWVRGTAEVRLPYFGCVRLWVSGRAPARCVPG